MMPYERDIYVDLLKDHLETEAERVRQRHNQ